MANAWRRGRSGCCPGPLNIVDDQREGAQGREVGDDPVQPMHGVGQRLAARALGMLPRKVFTKVVAPQVVRVVIPTAANDFITLLKITSLASIISVHELMGYTQTEVASSFRFAEWFAACAIYYLVIVSVFMAGQAWLERRFVWTSVARSQRSVIGLPAMSRR